MNVLAALEQEVYSKMSGDPAHDFAHTMRVYKNAKKICMDEKANQKLVLSAALLHDIVSLPKSDPNSKLSSIQSAAESEKILKRYDFTAAEIRIVCDAICDHSFSQNKIPDTIEGKILQDADRLDAIGAIGIARVFTVGGSEQRALYNKDDPFCKRRPPDDKTWTLDHFYQKLLKLESLMNTKYGKAEAKNRAGIQDFLAQLRREI